MKSRAVMDYRLHCLIFVRCPLKPVFVRGGLDHSMVEMVENPDELIFEVILSEGINLMNVPKYNYAVKHIIKSLLV